MMSQPNILHNFKSKNFDLRKERVQFIILHYTETNNLKEAIDLLTSKKRKVSSHFVVDINGKIYSLVCESKRAWHAGKSVWRGLDDINSRSIGVEIVNPGEKKLKLYPKIQIDELIKLIKYIKKKFKIPKHNILGHSDIAPLRKLDPGKHFPWKELYSKKIGMWSEVNQVGRILNKTELINFLQNLKKIGYGWVNHNEISQKNNKVINAFHRHFAPFLLGKKPTTTSLLKSFELLKLKKP